MLKIDGVTRRFGDVTALDNVSLEIEQGEFFALLGPSGCGKTTLLRILAGFETPDAGTVTLDGDDLLSMQPNRRPINLMFQSYALFPHMTVAKNIAYGLEQEKLGKAEIRQRVGEVLETIGLAEMAGRKPSQLSGGQRQRVALARAIVKRPRLLLLDEPLSALDKKVRAGMQLELKRLQHEVGITFVVVTHDQEEAMSLADRIAVFQTGQVRQVDEPVALYERPRTPFVADFVGANNLFEGTAVPGGLEVPGLGVLPAESAEIEDPETVEPDDAASEKPSSEESSSEEPVSEESSSEEPVSEDTATDGPESDGAESEDAATDGPDSPDAESDGAESDGAESEGTDAEGAETERAESEDTATDGPESGGAESDGAESDGAESEGTDAEGAETERAESEDTATDGPESGGAESDGAETDGAETDGAESEGTDAEGAETERAESDGANAEGTDGKDAESDGAGAEDGETEDGEAEGGEAEGGEVEGGESKGRKALLAVRPEKVRLSDEMSGEGLPGTVVDVSFYGGISHIAVTVEGRDKPVLVAQQGAAKVEAGAQVRLDWDAHDAVLIREG
ncbi:ATP-binding cassette domain-containing protein [Nonomuraea sp. NPDC003804]|uniref:ATP-binding cassette domain-containing protein n=1 Tax=Nonomuraea sp. NPDC003804 TaxID=3154547 RepID=UPI0033A37CB0